MEFALSVNQDVSSVGTTLKALATANTAVQVELQLGTGIQGLWIVTPEATQIASFEEHRGSDARSVVEGEPLYLGHDPFRGIISGRTF
jgi:hypothetical protein